MTLHKKKYIDRHGHERNREVAIPNVHKMKTSPHKEWQEKSLRKKPEINPRKVRYIRPPRKDDFSDCWIFILPKNLKKKINKIRRR